MKKKIIMILLMWLMVTSSNAQIYAGDTWMQMPTRDLYDPQIMSMALQHAEMAARVAAYKQARFEEYEELAYRAFQKNRWSDVIYNVEQALETEYYNGSIYYMRGYAYEQLGKLKEAKRDYKKGKKYNCQEAADALDALKQKMKKK